MSRPSKDEWLMSFAMLASIRSTCVRRSVGCVFADKDGFILAVGHNGVSAGQPHCNDGAPCEGASAASGVALNLCAAIHAEQNCVLGLKDRRDLHSVYVTVSPCASCLKLLLNTACQRIVFLDEYVEASGKALWLKEGREWLKLDHLKFTLLSTMKVALPVWGRVS